MENMPIFMYLLDTPTSVRDLHARCIMTLPQNGRQIALTYGCEPEFELKKIDESGEISYFEGHSSAIFPAGTRVYASFLTELNRKFVVDWIKTSVVQHSFASDREHIEGLIDSILEGGQDVNLEDACINPNLAREIGTPDALTYAAELRWMKQNWSRLFHDIDY